MNGMQEILLECGFSDEQSADLLASMEKELGSFSLRTVSENLIQDPETGNIRITKRAEPEYMRLFALAGMNMRDHLKNRNTFLKAFRRANSLAFDRFLGDTSLEHDVSPVEWRTPCPFRGGVPRRHNSAFHNFHCGVFVFGKLTIPINRLLGGINGLEFCLLPWHRRGAIPREGHRGEPVDDYVVHDVSPVKKRHTNPMTGWCAPLGNKDRMVFEKSQL
ncbi:MAG: hypothetical protein ACYCSH_00435 [Acidithiobacillus sp.]